MPRKNIYSAIYWTLPSCTSCTFCAAKDIDYNANSLYQCPIGHSQCQKGLTTFTRKGHCHPKHPVVLATRSCVCGGIVNRPGSNADEEQSDLYRHPRKLSVRTSVLVTLPRGTHASTQTEDDALLTTPSSEQLVRSRVLSHRMTLQIHF